jgi:hypothetical protein
MIRDIYRRTILSVAVLGLLELTPAGAFAGESYAWTPVVIPNVTIQSAFGVNDQGQITIVDVTGTVTGIYQSGRFTRLPAPPAGFTVGAIGINARGVIVGSAFTPPNPHEQSFILAQGQYRFFSRPGWDNTEARSIGPSGLVVGISSQDTGETAGFVYDPSAGTFTDVTPTGSLYTIAQGINKFGRISGSGDDGSQYPDSVGRYAFIWQQNSLGNGALAAVPFQERVKLVVDGVTNARGINDDGVISGWVRSNGQTTGFVGNASRGYQLLIPPGGDAAGAASYCQGINNARQVICTVTDANTGNTLAVFLGSPLTQNAQ